MTADACALAVDGIAKSFGATRALRGVSLKVASGSIHALLGGNGSGKSTLIKILAGVQQADAGSVTRLGQERPATYGPATARDLGFRFVHQHSSTFPDLSVTENLLIGAGFGTPAWRGPIDWSRARARAETVLRQFHIEARPEQRLSQLRPAVQVMVSIARALQQEGEGGEAQRRILVLDEPTAALSAPEVSLLMASLRRYAEAGQTIIIVTHRLEEVLELADRVTVLRDGQVAGDLARHEIDHDILVRLIAGRDIERDRTARPGAAAAVPVLEVAGLHGGPLAGIDLAVRAGEIVGVAGLLGSGRSSLLQTCFGAHRPSRGTIRLHQQPLAMTRPRDAMRAGIAYIPEDRVRDAAFLDLTVAENFSMAGLGRFWRGGRLRHRDERSAVSRMITAFLVRTAGPHVSIGKLSGGNQQKVILGRWLSLKPKLLLLDEPTQGVDVGARAEIYGLVRAAVSDGAAAVVVSSDFAELCDYCDRVVVIRKGRVVGNATGDDLNSDRLHEIAYAKEAA